MLVDDWYHTMIIYAMTNFNLTYLESRELSLVEFTINDEVFENRMISRDAELHKLAYLISIADAEEKQGNKTVRKFKEFSEFYNIDNFEEYYINNDYNEKLTKLKDVKSNDTLTKIDKLRKYKQYQESLENNK